MGKKTMVEEWEKLKIEILVSAGRATLAVSYDTATRVVALSWANFAYSGSFTTRAVLHNTGTRVAAPVASKILNFSYFPLESDCDVDD